eukprot:gene11363-14648_t
MRMDRPEVLGMARGEVKIVPWDPAKKHHLDPHPLTLDNYNKYPGEGITKSRGQYCGMADLLSNMGWFRLVLFDIRPGVAAHYDAFTRVAREGNSCCGRAQVQGRRSRRSGDGKEEPTPAAVRHALWVAQARILGRCGGCERLQRYAASDTIGVPSRDLLDRYNVVAHDYRLRCVDAQIKWFEKNEVDYMIFYKAVSLFTDPALKKGPEVHEKATPTGTVRWPGKWVRAGVIDDEQYFANMQRILLVRDVELNLILDGGFLRAPVILADR